MPSPHQPTTATPSPPVSDDDKSTPPPKPDPCPNLPPPPPTRTPVFPSREDCWSEEATRSLIEAWGSHYLELNRGNLRQKHWQEVADAVNAVHPKPHRTDVQCKNRVDTTKKKYKIEKSKLLQSNGTYVPTWPHFHSLDSLIGDTFNNNNTSSGKTTNSVNNNSTSSSGRALRRKISRSPEYSPESPETTTHHRKFDKGPTFGGQELRLPWTVPVGPRSKRTGPGSVTERNFSVMAAAAAAMEAEDDDDEEEEEEEEEMDYPVVGRKRRRKGEMEEQGLWEAGGGGYRRLAEAISRLGEIYEKVEEAKQRQLVELEKQRMHFAKDLEIQRMKVFMESQVQLEKLRQARRSSDTNSYL